MLRTYSYTLTNSRMPFRFNFTNDSIKKRDKEHLADIEHAINIHISDYYSKEYVKNGDKINITSMDFILPARLSLISKSILNQYDISHFDRSYWCGIKKYTIIKLDKVISRIIASHQNRNTGDRMYNSNKPLEHIISNSIDIKSSKKTSTSYNYSKSQNNIDKHDYLLVGSRLMK
jgi:hypothetical protein